MSVVVDIAFAVALGLFGLLIGGLILATILDDREDW